MRMKIPPCVENKCLKYPVCKSKVHIHCDEMSEYYKTTSNMSHVKRWKLINKFLPKACGVHDDKGKPLPPFPRKCY